MTCNRIEAQLLLGIRRNSAENRQGWLHVSMLGLIFSLHFFALYSASSQRRGCQRRPRLEIFDNTILITFAYAKLASHWCLFSCYDVKRRRWQAKRKCRFRWPNRASACKGSFCGKAPCFSGHEALYLFPNRVNFRSDTSVFFIQKQQKSLIRLPREMSNWPRWASMPAHIRVLEAERTYPRAKHTWALNGTFLILKKH